MLVLSNLFLLFFKGVFVTEVMFDTNELCEDSQYTFVLCSTDKTIELMIVK